MGIKVPLNIATQAASKVLYGIVDSCKTNSSSKYFPYLSIQERPPIPQVLCTTYQTHAYLESAIIASINKENTSQHLTSCLLWNCVRDLPARLHTHFYIHICTCSPCSKRYGTLTSAGLSESPTYIPTYLRKPPSYCRARSARSVPGDVNVPPSTDAS